MTGRCESVAVSFAIENFRISNCFKLTDWRSFLRKPKADERKCVLLIERERRHTHSSGMSAKTLTCRTVRYLNDVNVDSYNSSANNNNNTNNYTAEPSRPPLYTFNVNIPLINQFSVNRARMAPRRVSFLSLRLIRFFNRRKNIIPFFVLTFLSMCYSMRYLFFTLACCTQFDCVCCNYAQKAS